jgi:hypothetical protein
MNLDETESVAAFAAYAGPPTASVRANPPPSSKLIIENNFIF